MENIPEAPVTPEVKSEALPTTNEPTQAPSPDMHGFTSEDLASLRTWLDSNGGFDKVKSRLSNPQNYQQPQMPASQPQAQPVEPAPAPQPTYKTPEGAITAQEFLAQQYFQSLSQDPKYAPISQGIANGEYLKEMSAFGIQPLNPDGSINDQRVRMYLDLKAQTVPAQSTSTEPNMSPAPTVEYISATDGRITSMDQAYAILDQDMRLKAQGLAGNPDIALAEEYIKTGGKPAKK